MTTDDREDPGPGGFHVQGRRTWRATDGVARDEVRLADTETRSEAFRIANQWRREGLTIWVWEKADARIAAPLNLVTTLRPPRTP